jgi:hypothetical protein
MIIITRFLLIVSPRIVKVKNGYICTNLYIYKIYINTYRYVYIYMYVYMYVFINGFGLTRFLLIVSPRIVKVKNRYICTNLYIYEIYINTYRYVYIYIYMYVCVYKWFWINPLLIDSISTDCKGENVYICTNVYV